MELKESKILKPYYWLEEKYYSALDWVDQYIPVYKAIDPIEDRGIPTLAVILGVIALILLALLSYGIVLVSTAPEKHSLALTVQDFQGFKVKRAEVTVINPMLEGFEERGYTDSLGEITFKLEEGIYEAKAYKEGFLESSYMIIVRKDSQRTLLIERE